MHKRALDLQPDQIVLLAAERQLNIQDIICLQFERFLAAAAFNTESTKNRNLKRLAAPKRPPINCI